MTGSRKCSELVPPPVSPSVSPARREEFKKGEFVKRKGWTHLFTAWKVRADKLKWEKLVRALKRHHSTRGLTAAQRMEKWEKVPKEEDMVVVRGCRGWYCNGVWRTKKVVEEWGL